MGDLDSAKVMMEDSNAVLESPKDRSKDLPTLPLDRKGIWD